MLDLDTLPIGYDDFGYLRQDGCYFVDKSLFIKKVIDDRSQIKLITRPRRFGKTLNLSMLQHFLAPEVGSQPTAALFNDLRIAQVDGGRYVKEHQGQYPVLFLSFKDIKPLSYAEFIGEMRSCMAQLYTEFDFLLDSQQLKPTEKRQFQAVMDEASSIKKLTESLARLMMYLYRHHQKQRVWVLLDEYDTPFHEAYQKGYWEELVPFMQKYLGMAMKSNKHLHKAVVTGILRVAKESLFSGWNNVMVYNLFLDDFADAFGFTESEVQQLLAQAPFATDKTTVQTWYNGYRIGDAKVYNPWSILSYLKHKGEALPYWINTSHNQLLQQLIQYAKPSTLQAFTALLQGKPMECYINDGVVFANLCAETEVIANFLLMTGYLTWVDYQMTRGYRLTKLVFPNEEVRWVYENIITTCFTGKSQLKPQENFVHLLVSGDLTQFKQRFQEVVMHVSSIYDTASPFPENFYHGLLLGAVAFANSEGYRVESNREAGLGRFDMVIYPKHPQQFAVVIECKSLLKTTAKANKSKALATLAEHALQQINHQQYASVFSGQYDNILKIGIAFQGKQFDIVYEHSGSAAIREEK